MSRQRKRGLEVAISALVASVCGIVLAAVVWFGAVVPLSVASSDKSTGYAVSIMLFVLATAAWVATFIRARRSSREHARTGAKRDWLYKVEFFLAAVGIMTASASVLSYLPG